MAPTYKFVYFNARARGELVRLVFHAAGVSFTDQRVEFSDWPALKPKTPTGQLPYLEIDGVSFAESLCLARFLARQYKLMGKDEVAQLRCDIVVAQCDSVRSDWIRYTFDRVCSDAQKEELKKKFYDETFPAFLTGIEKQLGSNNFLVGDALTIADLAVFDICETPKKEKADVLDKFPKVVALIKRVESSPNVAKYLGSRPDSQV